MAKLGWLMLAAIVAVALVLIGQERPVGFEAEPGGTPEEQMWEVLLLMGVGDKQPAEWHGSVRVEGGELLEIEGYRFELPDRLLPLGGWRMTTKIERITRPERREQKLLPKGVLLRGTARRVVATTAGGECAFTPAALAIGVPQSCAGGRMAVHRVPAATDLSGTELRQHDFPSIGSGNDGALWATWLSYHDRQEELNFRRYFKGRWTRLIPVGRASADLWRPHAVTDSGGQPWLIWAQQKDSNWDIYAMPWEVNAWGDAIRLSRGALPDIEPHVARAGDGTVYVVWQSMQGRWSQVQMAYRRDGKWSEPLAVTSGEANHWEPAVAAGKDGRAWIVWDRYNASYDVEARSFAPTSGFTGVRTVAASDRMEAYASVAVDAAGRPWIAWETGGANWGKDTGPLSPRQSGSVLGDTRYVEVVCLDGGIWKSPAAVQFTDALGEGANSVSRPLLFASGDGSVWMTFQRRYSRQARNPSTHWERVLTRMEGDHWMQPVLLPRSAGRNSTRMSMAEADGRLWLFWNSEGRQYGFMSRPRAHRVIAGSLPMPGPSVAAQLSEYRPPANSSSPVHTDEAGDLKAIREHRVQLGKETLRIVRGDLHRHTELSQDQGGYQDGSLPEFYRYMIDAANMDFGASTDHQAGGIDYWNFMTLKMADMYHFPERFVPLYGYERNLGFPHGHRNIIHTVRNYAIVPFFQRPDDKYLLPDLPDGELLTFNSNSYGGGIENDTKLLYEELRKSGGMAIPHTSGSSGMGTDWRDNDPSLEPLVEIYQGDRHNYEHQGAPRGVNQGEEKKAIGGFQQAGMVWNAWKKGYKLGVIASSDHFSTHISYAMVYTPRQDRKSIFDAMSKRHAYGATDNIVLDFRMGEHFMGDVFRASKPAPLRVKARGTAPIAAVHFIRDGVYVHKAAPGTREVSVEYLDPKPGPGEHWYYVRVEQANGELAWSSPIWVTYR
ncbi:MAG: hypothetical protein JST93_12695 [Acidobacteria bacterium]|nr:hypothetical protein [Acidobacteriota bacterium]